MIVSGREKLKQRLAQINGAPFDRGVSRGLFVAADLVKAEAQQSITRGSVSGKGHIASKPGQPPNQDSGVLKNNIEAALTSPVEAEVSSNAPYSQALEFGTSKMAARPFMRVARDKVKPDVARIIAKYVNKSMKE